MWLFYFMPTFYILHSSSLNRYYIGSTRGEIAGRLYRHLNMHKGYTSAATDWLVVYAEIFDDYSLALKRELQVKKWKSRKMLDRLVQGKGSEHPD